MIPLFTKSYRMKYSITSFLVILFTSVQSQGTLEIAKYTDFTITDSLKDLHLDSLIFNDHSVLKISHRVNQASINAHHVIVRGTAVLVMENISEAGAVVNWNIAPQGDHSNKTGREGINGDKGWSPFTGKKLNLNWGIDEMDQLIIDVRGMEGGPGQNGGTGGKGVNAACEGDWPAGNGGRGGRGGAGGNGSASTALKLVYSSGNKIDTFVNSDANSDIRFRHNFMADRFNLQDPFLQNMRYHYYSANDSNLIEFEPRFQYLDKMCHLDSLYYNCFIKRNIKNISRDSITQMFKNYHWIDTLFIMDILWRWHTEMEQVGGAISRKEGGRILVYFPGFKRNLSTFTQSEVRLLSPPPPQFFKPENKKGIYIYNAGGKGGIGGKGGQGGDGGNGVECLSWWGKKLFERGIGNSGASGEDGSMGKPGITIPPIIIKLP